MTLEEAVRAAAERARLMHLDPQVTISEVYEAELLRRLQQTLRGGVVWKGGTVLRLEGSERFSRDLDATRRRASVSALKLERIFAEAARELPYLSDTEVSKHPGAVTATYRFEVPGLRQPVRVLVEISLRERVLLPATPISTARIAHPSGIEPVVVARLDAPELLAEQVRALVMRGASHDLYDVYWLLQRGADLDLTLFLRKMDYYRKLGRPVNPRAALEGSRPRSGTSISRLSSKTSGALSGRGFRECGVRVVKQRADRGRDDPDHGARRPRLPGVSGQSHGDECGWGRHGAVKVAGGWVGGIGLGGARPAGAEPHLDARPESDRTARRATSDALQRYEGFRIDEAAREVRLAQQIDPRVAILNSCPISSPWDARPS